MARFKNALTKYNVAELTNDDASEVDTWLPLAKFISNVEPEANDETEEYAWYDGDGVLTTEVTSARPSYTVEGQRFYGDEAQDLIASKEFETGDDRYIAFQKIDPNGDTFTGKATVSDIVTGGGEAQEHGAFSCVITWAQKPELEKVTSEDKTPDDETPGDTIPEG